LRHVAFVGWLDKDESSIIYFAVAVQTAMQAQNKRKTKAF